MSLTTLAWRNTRRQPKRSILTALAIALAVAAATFVDAYMNGATDNVLDTFIRMDAGHIKVVPVAGVDRVRPLPLDAGFQNVSSMVSLIEQVPDVEAVSARFRFPVLLDSGDEAVPAMGITLDPARETELINLGGFLTQGKLPTPGESETVLGELLAEELGLQVGDELFFVATTSYGGMGPGVYRISGLVSTGIQMLDRKQFYLPLAAAQDQLAMEESALEIVLRVKDGKERSREIAEQVQQALDAGGFTNAVAVPWQKQGYLFQAVQMTSVFRGIMMILLGVIALTTVINTVLMSVMERVREIGALRALGFSRGIVVRIILEESLIVGFAGTLAGVIAGMALSLWLQHTGIDFTTVLRSVEMPFVPIIYPHPSWMTAVKASMLGLLVSAVAAWYPARVAVRLEPSNALGNHRG